MVMVNLDMLIKECIKDNLKMEKWMEGGNLPGLMEEYMKDNILMIWNMVKVNLDGLMGLNILVNFEKENNMEKAF